MKSRTPSTLLALSLFLAASASSLSLACAGPVSELPDAFLLGGIQVNEPDMGKWHQALLSSGFNTLSLTVYARQGRWDSAEIEFDPDQLGGAMVREIRAAKRAGLNVVLILRVALEHALPANRFLWHGMIQPKSAADLDAWFFRYGDFVRQWAKVAEAEGVDVLGIGSELSSLASTMPTGRVPDLEAYYLSQESQARERAKALDAEAEVSREALKGGWGERFEDLGTFLTEQSAAHEAWAHQVSFGGDLEQIAARRVHLARNWLRVIEDARSFYSGVLTYAANFDQYSQVSFWDELDVIGINAYFPLRRTLSGAPVADLLPAFEDAWREILSDVDDLRATRGTEVPVLFTELGYTRWRGSSIQPWAGDGFAVLDEVSSSGEKVGSRAVVWRQQPLEEEERALAVRALLSAARERPGLLRGLLYWKLSTVPSHREIEPFVLVLDDGSPDPLLEQLVALQSMAQP